jgi:hypothetical protein
MHAELDGPNSTPTQGATLILSGKAWTLALMTSHTLSFIHLLLLMALIAVVYSWMFGRSQS